MDLWGDLTVFDAAMIVVFATCVFIYLTRLERRIPHHLGEQVGAHKAVLAKVRKREPLTQDEFDYATELVDDARSPLAFAIPAVLFAMGFFYVVGCLHELHVHGGHPSFRTFIGGIPMLTSMNMAAQLRRVAHLRKKLRGIDVTSDDSVAAGPRARGTTPLAEPDDSVAAGPRARGTTPLAEPERQPSGDADTTAGSPSSHSSS